MSEQLNLKKEEVFEELFFILKQYGNTETIDGMQFMLNNIVNGIGDGRTATDDINDINYLLNLAIIELTAIEHKLTKEHQEEFENYCDEVIKIDVIKDYQQGQLVIYDGLPYIVSEVDYDDLTMHLSDGGMMDNGMWVEDFTLLSKSV
jgi:hypothetical protein